MTHFVFTTDFERNDDYEQPKDFSTDDGKQLPGAHLEYGCAAAGFCGEMAASAGLCAGAFCADGAAPAGGSGEALRWCGDDEDGDGERDLAGGAGALRCGGVCAGAGGACGGEGVAGGAGAGAERGPEGSGVNGQTRGPQAGAQLSGAAAPLAG